ncbi:GtrA family protein [Dysgonomonas sp. 511]|uniref:GtrA family protein n=1 Tax=Dysgonomonas sp. 511 TaxID=2302930 RepID=UPI0013D31976|nr:GtrA family protein [Dysgonomonas sp. 511]NDV78396.1 GtrA family protein [Dysgonomonas sp. 511]
MKGKLIKLSKNKSFRQLVKYGMVGAVGAVIDLGVFYILAVKLSVHYPSTAYVGELLNNRFPIDIIDTDTSHIISNVLAIINNFVLNSYFTFRVTDNKLKRFGSFVGIAAIGLVISTTLMTIFIGQMGMPEMVAKILSIGIVAAMQFIINKLFTFKESKA